MMMSESGGAESAAGLGPRAESLGRDAWPRRAGSEKNSLRSGPQKPGTELRESKSEAD